MHQWVGEFEQFRQGLQRSRGYDIRLQSLDILNAFGMDDGVEVQFLNNSAKEIGFLACALDQMDFRRAHDAQDQTWKPGARTEIRNGFGLFRNKPHQLGAIKEMPDPDMGQGAG